MLDSRKTPKRRDFGAVMVRYDVAELRRLRRVARKHGYREVAPFVRKILSDFQSGALSYRAEQG